MTGTAQARIDDAAKKDPKRALVAQLENPKLLEFIRSVAPELDALGVVRVAYAHVQATPALANCTTVSIVRGVAEAAKLSLTVDGLLGHAYLVPFRNEAKMMLGYRGIQALAYRSGLVSRFHADTIHERDSWEYQEGVEVVLKHSRPLGDRGEIIGAYATAHMTAGGPPLVAVMGLEEIHARRARSSGYAAFKAGKIKSTPWETDFAAMAKKCPVRELGKQIPYPLLQGAALRDDAREEERKGGEVETIDLGLAEEEPTKETKAETKATACPKCGSIYLRADGGCPDCDPRSDVKEG
jgi:recombination protein RecT